MRRMALIVTFLLGIGNFALHKAVLESRSGLLARMPAAMRATGGKVSLSVEFVVLLGALLLIANGYRGWAWAYLCYSLLNGGAAWLILTRRV